MRLRAACGAGAGRRIVSARPHPHAGARTHAHTNGEQVLLAQNIEDDENRTWNLLLLVIDLRDRVCTAQCINARAHTITPSI